MVSGTRLCGFARPARWLAGGLLAALIAAGGAGQAAPPLRVVSINLCTDQLAMLVAAPGQLHSVSYLAASPQSSAMAEEARHYTLNHARAEEIYLMAPDLVLAGEWSHLPSIQILRDLGIRVEMLPAASDVADIPDAIRQMGEILGRSDHAEALARSLEDQLAALRPPEGPRPRAAIYFANGYMSGSNSLSGSILRAAGFDNLADEIGMTHGGNLPLESLVMAQPDALITGVPYPGASRSEAILRHPALARLTRDAARAEIADRDWLCGTPASLGAVARLAALRDEVVK